MVILEAPTGPTGGAGVGVIQGSLAVLGSKYGTLVGQDRASTRTLKNMEQNPEKKKLGAASS